MENTVTALEMRKKFGSILNRVERGEHITILRGNLPLATLIPAREHERTCSSQNKLKTLQEALAELELWQKKNKKKLQSISKTSDLVRKMREERWSSSTPRSR